MKEILSVKTFNQEVSIMGRDEHKKTKNNFLSQTLKEQKSVARDIEFAEELMDHDDKEAQARRRAAEKRTKEK